MFLSFLSLSVQAYYDIIILREEILARRNFGVIYSLFKSSQNPPKLIPAKFDFFRRPPKLIGDKFGFFSLPPKLPPAKFFQLNNKFLGKTILDIA